jgi:hypothetical protein
LEAEHDLSQHTYFADGMPPALPLEKENKEWDDGKDYVALVKLEL